MRKQREEEVFAEKQKNRMAMIDAQAARLADLLNDEDERVDRQVHAKEQVDEKKRLEKEEMQKRWRDDINRSREAQIQRKKATRQKEKADDAETSKFLNDW